jgi:enamine deaminase RidA (YjgF/YER057c/UK114 family)
VERRLISSDSSWEERYGYSRAVVAGRHVHVAGTAPIMPGDRAERGSRVMQVHALTEIARVLATV